MKLCQEFDIRTSVVKVHKGKRKYCLAVRHDTCLHYVASICLPSVYLALVMNFVIEDTGIPQK